MNTQNMEIHYSKIAERIDGMIPEEWSKVYVYGEVLKDVAKAYFYYFSKDDDKQPIYSQSIPELFNIDEDEFDMCWLQLIDCFKEFWQKFVNNEQEVWTNFTFILENTGKFKIDYDYTDLSEASPRKQHIIWKYKYLGIMPEDESDRKIVNEYIKSIENK